MFMFREKQSQVPLVPENYNITPPLLRTAAPPHFVIVYNKVFAGGGFCVSPSKAPVYLAQAL
jgi:hypothetical protein